CILTAFQITAIVAVVRFMKTRLPAVAAILFSGMSMGHAQSLSIHATGSHFIEITWPGPTTGLVLEAATVLGPAAVWETVAEPSVLGNSQYSVTLQASGGARFFRLRTAALASIIGSSPIDGETGVAVTRETIVYFSQPLADTAVLGTNNFYATFGGRRILSRIELATDRRKATLFYLEQLP